MPAESHKFLGIDQYYRESMCFHYENLPMQYTELFVGIKNENFQHKKIYMFLIFVQNIDCGYTLEPPR